MKWKFAWLVLPLVLGALMWGVKWRAEHPPVTKWDLQVRSLLAETSMRVVYSSHAVTRGRVKLLLSEEEKEAFIDSFHLSSQVSNMSRVSVGPNGTFDIVRDKPKPGRAYVSIVISLDHRIGKVGVNELAKPNAYGLYPATTTKVYDLHPATTKRWIELLLNRPELRQLIH